MHLKLVKSQPKIKLKAPTISITDVDGSTTTSTSCDVDEDLREFLMGKHVELRKIYVENDQEKKRLSRFQRCKSFCIVQ